ncbi:MAG: phytanoyl-CoA dioxygenase family protein [Gemmatimonadetes bacterium]|nr:phytanoyl-CoA dioxygenase family protein [Gemmatimonadota bacterium]MBT5142108.1 phytanoyl-CoA dioxygenase family protein [Gemmatimonadota bacterium]MBT5589307.1 phytanoyl-CoA dioxygenase family protein [Gemmatimonadota bacterium]MBT5963043.1 phytanoyl-CoA dioxygenase family protein [Gemmatimonadota bacterium]MBT6628553.1 phytanoyl-CoA dioxygenase family protein [Gemmatimonadota bacterium]
MSLTEDQIEDYRHNGYLVIDDVFSTQRVAQLRAAADSEAICAAVDERGGSERTVHLLEITRRHPEFNQLSYDERILSRLRPLIGDDIQLQHSKLATKPAVAGVGPYRWHQDFAFFPHTNTHLAAVMVMLDDATPENGCMQFLPGSHRMGLLNHLDGDGNFAECQERHLWADASKLVDITPRAGGISIHHCLMLHGSPPNTLGQPRRGLVYQYRADDAYQLADHVFADTGTVVSGERRGRVRCEEMAVALPRRAAPGDPYGDAWNQIGSEVDL